MKMQNGKVCNVNGLTVIPINAHTPSVVKALDISDLPIDQQDLIANRISDYTDYLTSHMSQAFSFEHWIEHTDPSFPLSNINWVEIDVDGVR